MFTVLVNVDTQPITHISKVFWRQDNIAPTLVYFVLAITRTVHLQFTVTPFVSHIVATIITTVILSWKELLFPLMSKMCVICYQPTRHKSFQPGAIFKLVTAVEHFGNGFPDTVTITVNSLVEKLYTRKPIWIIKVLKWKLKWKFWRFADRASQYIYLSN